MRRVELRFLAEELFAEIGTRCALAANAAGRAGRDVHDTRDVLDDGNREVIQNIISRLMFECMNLLYPFAKTPVRNCCHENDVDEVEEYAIVMDLRYDRSETEIQQLRRCVQDYVVCKCVAEWLALTMPDTGQWQLWEQKAEGLKEQVATVLVMPMRARELRVRGHFF